MARVSTGSQYIGRDSATADHPRPANQSPFRAHKASIRIKAARAMIAKRDAEIAQIGKAILKAETPKIQRILAQRLLASKHNRTSWLDYIAQDSIREARATLSPR